MNFLGAGRRQRELARRGEVPRGVDDVPGRRVDARRAHGLPRVPGLGVGAGAVAAARQRRRPAGHPLLGAALLALRPCLPAQVSLTTNNKHCTVARLQRTPTICSKFPSEGPYLYLL